jgi:hypothetical protein
MNIEYYTAYENHLITTDFFKNLLINEKILKYIDGVEWENSYQTNLMAEMSSWNIQHSLITEITDWVISSLIESRPHLNAINYSYHVHEVWIARYSKNDCAYNHSHATYPFSFVYFVNAPENSSPLCFSESNLNISAESGKLVIFPGNLKHYVAPNMSENRVVIAGNIIILNVDEYIHKKS